jgi:hypothetical protein
MKKVLLLTTILLIAVACKKSGFAPLGPTDIRVKNLTAINMTNVIVNTGGGEYNFGLIKADSVSGYYRFEKAYPKANISAVINGLKYKTDTITSYAYLQYLSQIKATYEVYIVSDTQRKLGIHDVIQEDTIMIR